MLHFDAATGLYPDEIATVRESVREDWIGAFRRDGLPDLNTEPETPAGQLIDAQTAAIVDKDNEVLFLANQFNPLTAQGVWQEALGKIYFLTRKGAEPSSVTCLCSGLAGTVIPAGALIRSSVDQSRWENTATVTIPDSGGQVNAIFRSVESGVVAAAANTLTEIVSVTPGWDAVTNPTAAVVGRVAETQAEFEQRRYNSVAANSRGSVYSLYGALADLEGVLDCVVLENITNNPIVEWGVTIPGHSVYISIVGGDNAAIAEAIYRKKDAGCGTAGNTEVTYQDDNLPWRPIYTYKIERPEPLRLGVRVTLRIVDDTLGNSEELIRAAIISNFNGLDGFGALRVSMAQTIYASRFYCPVVKSGVWNLLSIELAALSNDAQTVWGDSVTVNADQVPTLEAADITVVVQED